MQMSSHSPSMDEWQAVFADRSAPSSCAHRKSPLCRSSKNFSRVLLSTVLFNSNLSFFETTSADSSSHLWICLSGICTGNLSVQQEGAHRASYKD